MKRVVVDVIKQYIIEVDDDVDDPETHVNEMQSTQIELIGDLHCVETRVVEVNSDQETVNYTVKYRCEIDPNDPDAIDNIDIPEGGANNSKYCEDSFDFVGNDGDNHVFYIVKFSCDCDPDAIEDIDIPEGGANNSKYCENSFELSTKQ